MPQKNIHVCIKDYLQENDRMIHIVFGEFKNGKLITKATKAKMARGDMIWYMAQKSHHESRGYQEI